MSETSPDTSPRERAVEAGSWAELLTLGRLGAEVSEAIVDAIEAAGLVIAARPACSDDLYSFADLEEAYRAGFSHGEIAAKASVRDDPEQTVIDGFFDWMTRENVRPALVLPETAS